MRKSKHLDLNSRYSFPSQLRTVNFEGKILIIAPLSLTWVVLDNDDQLLFFTSLQSRTVADAITAARVSGADVRHVLTQIEARGLCERPSGDVDVFYSSQLMRGQGASTSLSAQIIVS